MSLCIILSDEERPEGSEDGGGLVVNGLKVSGDGRWVDDGRRTKGVS